MGALSAREAQAPKRRWRRFAANSPPCVFRELLRVSFRFATWRARPTRANIHWGSIASARRRSTTAGRHAKILHHHGPRRTRALHQDILRRYGHVRPPDARRAGQDGDRPLRRAGDAAPPVLDQRVVAFLTIVYLVKFKLATEDAVPVALAMSAACGRSTWNAKFGYLSPGLPTK